MAPAALSGAEVGVDLKSAVDAAKRTLKTSSAVSFFF